MSKVTISVIVRINDNLLYHNLRINHNEFQRMLARGGLERGIETTDIIKDLIATRQGLTIHKTAQ
jgi:hypothetical protein